MKTSLISAFSLLAGLASGAKRPVFVYTDTNINWSNVCEDIEYMVDQGTTEILLSFFMYNTGVVDAALTWNDLSADQRTKCLDYVHQNGARIGLAAGGATELPFTVDATDYGTKAAKTVLDMGLDGLDFDLENLPPGFGDHSYYTWMIQASKAARTIFDNSGRGHLTISHAPQAPYFTSWAGSNKGYLQLMKDLGDVVDYYLVQYYNQQACSYLNYDATFLATEAGCWAPGAAMKEIQEQLGADGAHLMPKIVIGKPATLGDVYNTGFVDPVTLASILCEAESNIGYTSGIMVWSYRGKNNAEMQAFFANVPGEICGSSATPNEPHTAPAQPETQSTMDQPPMEQPQVGASTAPVVVQTDGTTSHVNAPVEPVATKAPAPAGSICYANSESVWWQKDCTSDELCMPTELNQAECESSDLPYAMMALTVDECRSSVQQAGGCQTLPSGAAQNTDKGNGCYHNIENVWWASDCTDSQLCEFDANYPDADYCNKSGFPYPHFGSLESCRDFVKSMSGCLA